VAITTADNVADYILWHTREYGELISNLQLQKLVYYAQAWFLVFYDEPLFDEPIQAWIHGPVQPGLYHRFKEYAWQPIIAEVDCPVFHDSDGRTKRLLKEVVMVYGSKTGIELELLAHSEDPWKMARQGIPDTQESTNVITHESMKEFYKSQLSSG